MYIISAMVVHGPGDDNTPPFSSSTLDDTDVLARGVRVDRDAPVGTRYSHTPSVRTSLSILGHEQSIFSTTFILEICRYPTYSTVSMWLQV